ncbi:MAG: transposase [Eggerthellaceae bacterium]|nr:transposase [Eggerthellaceae bacterium]
MEERSSRRRSEAEIYHVYSRGVGKQIVYETDKDRNVFCKVMRETLAESELELYAWCLMDNHFHLLMHGSIDAISDFMKLLLSQYARYFNSEHGRQGHVFQSRFGSEPIDSESYLLNAVRYIHQNPEKAVLAPTDRYRWSSYQEYVHVSKITTTAPLMRGFGTVAAFEVFHRRYSRFSLREYDDGKGAAMAKRALAIAIDELGEQGFMNLRSLPMAERNSRIKRLANRGLSIRQIERLTGVNRNSISRIV